MLNASKRATKGKPKNHLADDDIVELARLYNAGEPVDGEVAVVATAQIADADYNLSPSRWIQQSSVQDHRSVKELLAELEELNALAQQADQAIAKMLVNL